MLRPGHCTLHASSNPEGIVSSSPGLRGTSYPGYWPRVPLNSEGVVPFNRPCHNLCVGDYSYEGVGATSSRLRGALPEISQGSSLLATLGFIAESLWDSRSLASIKISVRCSEDGRTPLPSLRPYKERRRKRGRKEQLML